MSLKQVFFNLVNNYSTNLGLIDSFWNELEKNYSHKSRHYHSLKHIENLYQELLPIKDKFNNWEVVMFSLFYHDVIYDAKSKKNEEKSAELAVKKLKEINFNSQELVYDQIIATKNHLYNDSNDTNLFTDADLSILGSDWECYKSYFQNVRKEYAIYPDLLYKPGRKKALKHFLEMDSIFKTDYFKLKYEEKARLNMGKEIEML